MPLLKNILPELSSHIQQFLVELSVFHGTWSVEAATEILQVPDARRFCEDLHAQHILLKEEGTDRFRMEADVRDFLIRRLSLARLQELQQRHLDWYQALAADCAPRLERTPDKAALDRMEVEKPNLFAAARFAQGAAKVRLALGLWRWMLLRGHYSEGLHILGYAYIQVRDASIQEKIALQRGMGLLDRYKGQYNASASHLTISLRLARNSRDPACIAQILVDLAFVESLRGNHDTASRHHTEALALFETAGDVWGMAATLNGMGTHAWKQGDLEAACGYLYRSAEHFNAVNDSLQAMKVYSNVGMLHAQRKDYSQAEKVHRMCLAHFRRYNSPNLIALSLLNLGDVLADQGRIFPALEFLSEGLQITIENDIKGYIPTFLVAMGFALSAATPYQDINRAVMLFGAAEALREQYQESTTPAFEEALDTRIKEIRMLMLPAVFGRLYKRGKTMPLDTILKKFGSRKTILAKGT